MKRFILLSLFLVSCLCMNGFILPPAETNPINYDAVIAEADQSKVAEAKMQNLLNLNNVYGDDFTNNEALVNAAAINLRSYANENGFIENDIVVSYLKDIYDIDIVINDTINVNLPQKQGYVYLIPRGYTAYSHEIVSISENEEFITVVSLVYIDTHDSQVSVGTATTKLVKNPSASFGYNIIDSEIDYNAISAAA